MKPIEEAMEDDVFEASANDSQNNPEEVQDDIAGDLQSQLNLLLQPQLVRPLCEDDADRYGSEITSGARLLSYTFSM